MIAPILLYPGSNTLSIYLPIYLARSPLFLSSVPGERRAFPGWPGT